MAALSGPASTMTVLRGETAANFFTKRGVVAGQRHGTKDALQARERVIGRGGASFEEIDGVFTGDDNGVAQICGLAGLAKVALEFRERRLHVESDYLIRCHRVNTMSWATRQIIGPRSAETTIDDCRAGQQFCPRLAGVFDAVQVVSVTAFVFSI
jgi:hypothetical protein